MTRPGPGHRLIVRRYLVVIFVVGGLLLVLGIMLVIGVIRGDDADIERRQENPGSAPAAFLS